MTFPGQRRRRLCPVCRGTGLDPTLSRRYTIGGHDDRSCRRCLGECYVELAEDVGLSGPKEIAEEQEGR